MKKTVSTVIAATLFGASFAGTAVAQYHSYTSREPSIIIDMSVLEEAEQQPKKYDPQTHTTVPKAVPVTQVPLSWINGSADNKTAEEQGDIPAPIASEQPASTKKRILKPTFARPVPETAEKSVVEAVENDAPALAPAPVPLPRPAETARPEIARPLFARPPEEQPQAPANDTASEIVEEEQPLEEVDVTEVEPATPSVNNLPAVPTLSDLTLVFTQTQNDLDPAMQQKLDGIAAHLAQAIDSRLQVRAYAMGEDGTKASARRISLSRALAVRSYLMDKGVKPVRVDVRALGTDTDREPIDRVDLVFAK